MRARESAAALADLEQPRCIPQRRLAAAGEHRDQGVAQVAVRAAANLALGEEAAQRGDDVIRDRVRRGLHRERVEPRRRRRHVEQRTAARRRHDAEDRLGGVALRIEHDHRTVGAAEVLRDARDEERGLALLDRADDGDVLAAQRLGDRDRAVVVEQQALSGTGP